MSTVAEAVGGGLKVSPFQERVLAIPECFDLFLGGGRGGVTWRRVRGKFYPRGSIILLDELASVCRDNLNQGLGWTAATTAEAIRKLCARWKAPPTGVADDAGLAKTGHTGGSIADEFARGGVRFVPAKKADRIPGWQKMRRLLADAGKLDIPGLYVSRACEYLWAASLPPSQGYGVYDR